MKQQPPYWLKSTPEECHYSLDMFDSGGTEAESVDLDRDEYIALKEHLVGLRGYERFEELKGLSLSHWDAQQPVLSLATAREMLAKYPSLVLAPKMPRGWAELADPNRDAASVDISGLEGLSDVDYTGAEPRWKDVAATPDTNTAPVDGKPDFQTLADRVGDKGSALLSAVEVIENLDGPALKLFERIVYQLKNEVVKTERDIVLNVTETLSEWGDQDRGIGAGRSKQAQPKPTAKPISRESLQDLASALSSLRLHEFLQSATDEELGFVRNVFSAYVRPRKPSDIIPMFRAAVADAEKELCYDLKIPVPGTEDGEAVPESPEHVGLTALMNELPESWLAKFITETLRMIDHGGISLVACQSAMLAEDFINAYNAAGDEARRVLAVMEAAKSQRPDLSDYAAMPRLSMDETRGTAA